MLRHKEVHNVTQQTLHQHFQLDKHTNSTYSVSNGSPDSHNTVAHSMLIPTINVKKLLFYNNV